MHRWACDYHERAVPHIKSYCRYDPAVGTRRLLWFLLTSSNLSKVVRDAGRAFRMTGPC